MSELNRNYLIPINKFEKIFIQILHVKAAVLRCALTRQLSWLRSVVPSVDQHAYGITLQYTLGNSYLSSYIRLQTMVTLRYLKIELYYYFTSRNYNNINYKIHTLLFELVINERMSQVPTQI